MRGFTEKPQDAFVAEDTDAAIARRAADAIKAAGPEPCDVTLTLQGHQGQTSIALPATALALIEQMLDAMANQTPLSIVPHNAVLTTQEAADLLHVSRPFLVNLLEEGQIPFHMIGTHRRVLWSDLSRFKAASKERQLRAIANMITESKRLGLE